LKELRVIELENKLMANVYSKKQIVIAKGKGAILWDNYGKEYIDCMSNYGVSLVGHSHPKVVETIKKQSELLISCHGSLYNEARSIFLEKLVSVMPKELNKVFLSNSGTEAIECAIKLARKFTGKNEIIAMVGGYHGKTFGALSATWNKKYRTSFEPLVPFFKHVSYGNSIKIRESISENTAAILVEPIQGEGGIRIPPTNFLKELREICDEKNVLLIFDEIQTGLGRTGKMFACQYENVVPDIICLAKPIAGGLPMGATISREDIMSSFRVGEHSTTFGGSALVCAIGSTILEIIKEENLPERAGKLGSKIIDELRQLQNDCKIIREVRGLGLMIGIEFRFDVLNILLKALERGILVVDAGRNIVRLLPPLVIKQDHLNRAIEVLSSIIREEENERLCD
jgi:acetylornithine/LysW-gamma-L-lysine aminotransferase